MFIVYYVYYIYTDANLKLWWNGEAQKWNGESHWWNGKRQKWNGEASPMQIWNGEIATDAKMKRWI